MNILQIVYALLQVVVCSSQVHEIIIPLNIKFTGLTLCSLIHGFEIVITGNLQMMSLVTQVPRRNYNFN
jgi:hypothetical protein